MRVIDQNLDGVNANRDEEIGEGKSNILSPFSVEFLPTLSPVSQKVGIP
jgi:hypothetical protein